MFRATACIRSKYLMTSLADEQAVTHAHYGTMILVDKALFVDKGCTASVSFDLYEGTKCGRGLSMLELRFP